VGQALRSAKQTYYLDVGFFDAYDEKILIQSTLYGLPMYRYVTLEATLRATARPEPEVGATVVSTSALDNQLIVESTAYFIPTLTQVITDVGTYLELDGAVHVGHGEPIQPKHVAELTQPHLQTHGVVLRGGTYTDVTSFDPVVEWVVTETTVISEPVFSAPGWYPPVFWALNRQERGQRLVMLLGQFNAQSQTERLYDRLDYDIYYHPYAEDWTPPAVKRMGSVLIGGQAQITVGAEDTSGIAAVVVAYTDGTGSWHSVSLEASGEAWTGSFPATAATAFFIQVVDGAGNVAMLEHDGRYFTPGESLSELYLPVVLKAQ
jgi:hypothetical protein